MAKKNHNKKQMEKPNKKYLELLYMSPMAITAKDIASLLTNNKGIRLEHWEAMNVIELELPSLNSVDIEPIEVDFSNPSDAAFVKNRGIQTIFGVNINEQDLSTVKEYFKPIVEEFSGFLCTDSPDFSPIHLGTIEIKNRSEDL